MSELLDPFEALSMVPGWDAGNAVVEELKGGLTNRTYLVRRGEQACVMRLDARRSTMFRFDRSSELAILEEAARAGIAPQIVHSDLDVGILVTEYVHGRAWDEEDLRSFERLEALAKLLRRVHALPRCGRRIDMTDVAESYEVHLEQHQGLHAFAGHCVDVIGSIPVREAVACCHNDIVAANVVGDAELKLIDWEFSCDNDPLFDLASAIGFHNLDEARAGVLLDAYSGGADGAMRERLQEQVRVYDAIQWLWLATRHRDSPQPWQARRLEELQQRIG